MKSYEEKLLFVILVFINTFWIEVMNDEITDCKIILKVLQKQDTCLHLTEIKHYGQTRKQRGGFITVYG